MSENTGGPADSQHVQEQAETAIVTAYYPQETAPLPVLSTTYNDFSIGKTFDGQDEFEYPTPPAGSGLQYGDHRIIHRGASVMGWAWSTDGQSWTYGGKARPPRNLPSCQFDAECPSGTCQGGQCTCPNGDSDCMAPGASCDTGSGTCVANPCPSGTDAECAPGYQCTNNLCEQEAWAGIAGDPSMAVDPATPFLVYAVQLGVSDASYDLAPDPNVPNLHFAIDGFCIARSADAGETFGAGPDSGNFPYIAGGRAFCQRVTPAHAPVTPTTTNVGVDKTAVAVDWRGRVWVATEDREAGTIAIFHNQDELDGWDHFTRVQTCTGSPSDAPDCISQEMAQFVGQYEPVLKISPPCRDYVDSPSCTFAPNGSGSIFLESIHYDANNVAHLLQVSFGAAYDSSLKTCAGGPCPCTTSSDCGTGLICDSTSHLCGPPACTTDQDCVSGWHCDTSLGGCVQPTSWAGADMTALCQLGTVGPAVAPDHNLVGFYGTTNENDGPQDGAQSITDAFRHSFDIGVDSSGTTTDILGSPSNITVTDSFPCPHQSGYWGDYFGLTQFPAGAGTGNVVSPVWLNAASFTFSAHRPANAGDVCSVYQRQRLGAPMDIDAFTWPSVDLFP